MGVASCAVMTDETVCPPANAAAPHRRVGLDAVSDADGSVRVLAIDHRDSMRRFLASTDPDNASPADGASITALKADIVRALIDISSGVMLEPEFSIPQLLDAGLIPRNVGVIAALEAQGYLDDLTTAVTSVLPGWSPRLALEAGASMVKLLLPYRPGSDLAQTQEAVARDVLASSAAAGIPLVLEPLLWGVSDPDEHARLVVETAERFAPLRPGLLKLPFPGDGRADASASANACRAITEVCANNSLRWALLSGGGTFERFEDQLSVALAEGCSGFMVGRALWGDAVLTAVPDRLDALNRIVVPRLRHLNLLTTSRG